MKNKVIISIFVIILIISLIMSYMVLSFKFDSSVAVVYQNEEEIYRIDLSNTAKAYDINLEDGDRLNIIRVEQGKICIKRANCSDQICVKQGYITDGLLPIVCLPNHLVIKIEGSESGVADAVAK